MIAIGAYSTKATTFEMEKKKVLFVQKIQKKKSIGILACNLKINQ